MEFVPRGLCVYCGRVRAPDDAFVAEAKRSVAAASEAAPELVASLRELPRVRQWTRQGAASSRRVRAKVKIC